VNRQESIAQLRDIRHRLNGISDDKSALTIAIAEMEHPMLAVSEGPSLRDDFAGRAMQAMQSGKDEFYGDGAELASDAYMIADAMLIEREKGAK
jgi:hypothetical protein